MCLYGMTKDGMSGLWVSFMVRMTSKTLTITNLYSVNDVIDALEFELKRYKAFQEKDIKLQDENRYFDRIRRITVRVR